MHGNYGRYRLIACATRKQTIRFSTVSLSLSCTAPFTPRTSGSFALSHSLSPAQHLMMAEGLGGGVSCRRSAPSSPGNPNIDRRRDSVTDSTDSKSACRRNPKKTACFRFPIGTGKLCGKRACQMGLGRLYLFQRNKLLYLFVYNLFYPESSSVDGYQTKKNFFKSNLKFIVLKNCIDR